MFLQLYVHKYVTDSTKTPQIPSLFLLSGCICITAYVAVIFESESVLEICCDLMFLFSWQSFYSVFGVVGGPVVGAFCLGMFTRRAHSRVNN